MIQGVITKIEHCSEDEFGGSWDTVTYTDYKGVSRTVETMYGEDVKVGEVLYSVKEDIKYTHIIWSVPKRDTIEYLKKQINNMTNMLDTLT